MKLLLITLVSINLFARPPVTIKEFKAFGGYNFYKVEYTYEVKPGVSGGGSTGLSLSKGMELLKYFKAKKPSDLIGQVMQENSFKDEFLDSTWALAHFGPNYKPQSAEEVMTAYGAGLVKQLCAYRTSDHFTNRVVYNAMAKLVKPALDTHYLKFLQDAVIKESGELLQLVHKETVKKVPYVNSLNSAEYFELQHNDGGAPLLKLLIMPATDSQVCSQSNCDPRKEWCLY